MLQSIGYPLNIVVVDTSGAGWNHVYLHVGIPPTAPDEWLPFDLAATKGDLGCEPSMIARKKMYAVQGEDFSIKH